jgi:hypothetical protein
MDQAPTLFYTHSSGLFKFTEYTSDKQGQHYIGAVLLRNIQKGGRKGMTLDWITEVGGLLLGWVGREVAFTYSLPFEIHPSFN